MKIKLNKMKENSLNLSEEKTRIFNYRKDDPRDFVSQDFIDDIKSLMIKYADVLERLKYE